MEREAAAKNIASTLHKNEKALETLRAKNAKPWQIQHVTEAVAHHRIFLALVEGRAVDADDRKTALAAIPGCIARIEPYLEKFAPGTAQHTLAVRRIEAYKLAEALAKGDPL